MANHNITVSTDLRAVQVISGIGTIYTFVAILLVCCLAGHVATSFIALVADLGLIGGYIYIAVTNRQGASSCSGSSVSSPYGTGDANATPSSPGRGIVPLPTFGTACHLESACLVTSCIATVFFAVSICLECSMNRSRFRALRPKRDAEGEYLHKSDIYGAPYPLQQQQQQQYHGGGLWGLVGAHPFQHHGTTAAPINPDALPMHQLPSQYMTRVEPIETWGEVQSLHDSDRLYFNDGEQRNASDLPRIHSTTAPRPAADTYIEGDAHVADQVYNLYQEDARSNDFSETGRRQRQRDERGARVERMVAAYN